MKIIEAFIEGKFADTTRCEDGLYIGNHFVAVIDGVTSKGQQLWEGVSSGVWAKNRIIKFLQNVDIADFTAETLFQALSTTIYMEHVSIEEIPRASVVLYSDIHHEVWSYGDCQFKIVGKEAVTSVKRIDTLLSTLRSFLIESFLKSGVTVNQLLKNDQSRDALAPYLYKQFQFENCSEVFGYPVLNGQMINSSQIICYSVEPGQELILATDGYPFLRDTLEASEGELLKLITQDPLCYNIFRSTKGMYKNQVSFDDRTYCRIEIQ
ncbi:TPA: hypothetical protein U1W10_000597 [Streptococcus suis]|nr:hypothetical protein [Streptococcus suis]HEM4050622.1 hypothetical protein [Streptococcus suis]